jgi:ATP-binding cassette subfamily B protein
VQSLRVVGEARRILYRGGEPEEGSRVEKGGGAESPLRQLAAFMSPRHKRRFMLVLGLMVIGAFTELIAIGAVLPFLTLLADPERISDLPAIAGAFSLVGAESFDERLLAATIFLMAAAIVAGAVRVYLAWTSQRFVFDFGHALSVEIQRRVLGQPYAWHISRNSRDIVASLEKVQVMASSVALQFIQAITAAILALFIVAALLVIDPMSAIASATVLAFIYLGVSSAARRRLGRNSRTVNAAYSDRVGIVQESLGGIRDVIIDSAQPVFLDAFREIDRMFSRARAQSAFIGAAPRFIIEATGIVLIAGLALFLADREGSFAAALPLIGALALGAQRLLPLIQHIYYGWSSYAGNRDVFDDILALLRLPPPPPPSDGPPLPLRNSIRLEKVSFAYPGRGRPALDAVSLTIPRGARVALVGPTGSGKSTLADIIMGLLEPQSGAVAVDGAALDGAARAAWRRSIAHVSQAIFLADTSIARNIAFGRAEAEIDMARVEESARRARLHDFVATLPLGYETQVGERGVGLSGGQRQRLGLARALYKGAPVLVLDEATSALDPATEAQVLESLADLSADGLTIITIAHRLSPVFACDLVVRLEDGRVAAREGGSDSA